MKKDTITLERTFDAPIGDIWRALTVKELMKEWYFDVAEFKAEKGFEFQFSAGETPEKQYVHLCKVLEVVEGRKLVYSWQYEGYEGYSVLSFELLEVADGTKIKLTHTGLDTFPATNPDFVFSNFEGGWSYFIDTSLPEFLSKMGNSSPL